MPAVPRVNFNSLVAKQPLLDMNATCVAREIAVMAYHPVTGHDHANGIVVTGHAYRPGGSGAVKGPGDVAVGSG